MRWGLKFGRKPKAQHEPATSTGGLLQAGTRWILGSAISDTTQTRSFAMAQRIDQLVDRFLKFADAGDLTVVIAGGVRGEVLHPDTPGHVQAAVVPRIFNLRPVLNSMIWTPKSANVRVFCSSLSRHW